MKENVKDHRTTFPGAILILVSLLLFVVEHFVVMVKEPDVWVLVGMFFTGWLLVMAPKKFADYLQKVIDGLINKFLK